MNVYFFFINQSMAASLKQKQISIKLLKGNSIEYYNGLLIEEYRKRNNVRSGLIF